MSVTGAPAADELETGADDELTAGAELGADDELAAGALVGEAGAEHAARAMTRTAISAKTNQLTCARKLFRAIQSSPQNNSSNKFAHSSTLR